MCTAVNSNRNYDNGELKGKTT